MKYKNAFFRIEIKENGTYLDLFPPKDGGKKLEFEEIRSYIDAKGIKCSDMHAVKETFDGLADKPRQVLLTKTPIEPINEMAKLYVSGNGMLCYMRFYPPSTNGKLMSKREVMAELEMEKVNYGVMEQAIDYFLTHRQYCANVAVAKGTPPKPAHDTVIEYFFDTKPLKKPKELEDGSVDFHALDLFSTVHAGDVLAKLTPHDPGLSGMNVYGKNVPTNKFKIKMLKQGKNVTLSEDKTTLTSNADGNVTLSDGIVYVSDTYTVAADVDASTGDISYDGNIMVNGNVRTGFTLKAQGDIQINGVVEGATIEAGGNVVIKRGVQGMNKGHIHAGGDICAQFFESAKVKAGGDVKAGSILHSEVQCGNSVIVSGKKGFIVGGEVLCDKYVEANSLGNKMETQTVIKVGVKPELYAEMKHLVPKVNEINEKYNEISSYLNVYKEKLKLGQKLKPEQLKSVKEYSKKLDELEDDKESLNNRLLEIKEEIKLGRGGSVKVLSTSYRGAMLSIASLTYSVKEKDSHCHYKIVDGEIRATGF